MIFLTHNALQCWIIIWHIRSILIVSNVELLICTYYNRTFVCIQFGSSGENNVPIDFFFLKLIFSTMIVIKFDRDAG